MNEEMGNGMGSRVCLLMEKFCVYCISFERVAKAVSFPIVIITKNMSKEVSDFRLLSVVCCQKLRRISHVKCDIIF